MSGSSTLYCFKMHNRCALLFSLLFQNTGMKHGKLELNRASEFCKYKLHTTGALRNRSTTCLDCSAVVGGSCPCFAQA
jgi:hypothetical protein